MKDGPQNISRKTRRDIRTLHILTAIYCRDHHGETNGRRSGLFRRGLFAKSKTADLCPDCENFMAYAIGRLCRCPLDPKPACRDCHIHCFAPGQRKRVRRIMRYGWPRIIRRGRIDLLWRLLVAKKGKSP